MEGSEDEALDAVTAPDFDARSVAVTESPVSGVPRQPVEAAGGRARITSYGRGERVDRGRVDGAGGCSC